MNTIVGSSGSKLYETYRYMIDSKKFQNIDIFFLRTINLFFLRIRCTTRFQILFFMCRYEIDCFGNVHFWWKHSTLPPDILIYSRVYEPLYLQWSSGNELLTTARYAKRYFIQTNHNDHDFAIKSVTSILFYDNNCL